MAIAWELGAAAALARPPLRLLATDADEHLLERARQGCYRPGSFKDLPPAFREAAFEELGGLFCVRERFRASIEFRLEDVREAMPEGPFRLVLCRNLAFTYFDRDGQRSALDRIAARLLPGGYLVIGTHESLPSPAAAFVAEPSARGVFRRSEAQAR